MISHRRSGNHFFQESIVRNFEIEGGGFRKNHALPKGIATIGDRFHPFPGKPRIYIVRDGRDVLASCYFWHLKSGEIDIEWKWRMENRDWSTFGEFLRSPVFMHNNALEGEFKNPIRYWKHHVLSWLETGIKWFRYEDLYREDRKTLKRIGRSLRLKTREGADFSKIEKLVGFNPRKGIVGDWKDHFEKGDLRLFQKTCRDLMVILGYRT